jgi:hypothetical protein
LNIGSLRDLLMKQTDNGYLLSWGWLAGLLLVAPTTAAAESQVALPPPEEVPEEVLRTEIILPARSPIDGEPMSPAEYAQLQERLQENTATRNRVNPDVEHTVFMLRLLRLFKTITPF